LFLKTPLPKLLPFLRHLLFPPYIKSRHHLFDNVYFYLTGSGEFSRRLFCTPGQIAIAIISPNK
ncbi:MAG: hypothetical protein AAGU74_09430, partial [Bacillota bacterium]